MPKLKLWFSGLEASKDAKDNLQMMPCPTADCKYSLKFRSDDKPETVLERNPIAYDLVGQVSFPTKNEKSDLEPVSTSEDEPELGIFANDNPDQERPILSAEPRAAKAAEENTCAFHPGMKLDIVCTECPGQPMICGYCVKAADGRHFQHFAEPRPSNDETNMEILEGKGEYDKTTRFSIYIIYSYDFRCQIPGAP